MFKRVTIPIETDDEELIPSYSTPLASGADAKAAIAQPVIIPPGASALIPTGLKCPSPKDMRSKCAHGAVSH